VTARRIAQAFALLLGAGVILWILIGLPYKGYPGDAVELVVPRGTAPAEVARLLGEAGVIRSPLIFRIQAKLMGRSERLQAGEYRFEGPISTGEALRRITEGNVILHRVTFPEGLAGREVIDRLVELGLASREELSEAFTETGPVEDLDPSAADLEGYLFPDTYHFARSTPARQILGAMVRRFREELGDGIGSSARRLGLSVREVVTMASLVEKETSLDRERGRVSAVFHNRLRLRMPLQCDPTVIYALAADGRYSGSLSRADLAYDSPYNTYVNPGLPPGPIAAPGRASLEAAVHPDDTDDLYFVADGSGGHTFSRSLEDHVRAVERYRRLGRRGT